MSTQEKTPYMKVWVVWKKGTDGNSVGCVCKLKSTAMRMAQMSVNCWVDEDVAMRHNGKMYAPTDLIEPSKYDIEVQTKMNKKEIARKKIMDKGIPPETIEDMLYDPGY